jgi:hypothetical protein
MPSFTRDNAPEVVDYGAAEDRVAHFDDWTISFTTIREESDLGPVLAAALPEGHCTCPHWGYVFAGTLTVTYPGGKDVFEAGEAFYMPPGHAPAAAAGTEFVMFSPKEPLEVTEAAIRAHFESMGGPPD